MITFKNGSTVDLTGDDRDGYLSHGTEWFLPETLGTWFHNAQQPVQRWAGSNEDTAPTEDDCCCGSGIIWCPVHKRVG